MGFSDAAPTATAATSAGGVLGGQGEKKERKSGGGGNPMSSGRETATAKTSVKHVALSSSVGEAQNKKGGSGSGSGVGGGNSGAANATGSMDVVLAAGLAKENAMLREALKESEARMKKANRIIRALAGGGKEKGAGGSDDGSGDDEDDDDDEGSVAGVSTWWWRWCLCWGVGFVWLAAPAVFSRSFVQEKCYRNIPGIIK